MLDKILKWMSLAVVLPTVLTLLVASATFYKEVDELRTLAFTRDELGRTWIEKIGILWNDYEERKG